MNEPRIIEFLRESNAIEGVYDEDSLVQAEVAWDYLMSHKKITPSVVLKTHKLLMLHQKLWPNEKGYFREVMVYVGGRPGMNPAVLASEIALWCDVMNAPAVKGTKEPLSKNIHILYEKIHPFVDGNGRTGRMFMNWYRLKNKMPLLVIHQGKEQRAYYEWFL